jgi:hypothetical protein
VQCVEKELFHGEKLVREYIAARRAYGELPPEPPPSGGSGYYILCVEHGPDGTRFDVPGRDWFFERLGRRLDLDEAEARLEQFLDCFGEPLTVDRQDYRLDGSGRLRVLRVYDPEPARARRAIA